jgi:hypothetical protein
VTAPVIVASCAAAGDTDRSITAMVQRIRRNMNVTLPPVKREK